MHTSDQGSVFSQGYYGIYHIAEYSLLLGVKLRDVPPDIGIHQQVLAKHGLPARGLLLCWNFKKFLDTKLLKSLQVE
jgi:hypothetical protein